jgi:hypothetical protein
VPEPGLLERLLPGVALAGDGPSSEEPAPHAGRRRSLAIVLAVLALVLIVAATLAKVLTSQTSLSSTASSRSVVTAADQARDRRAAATWIVAQVSHDALVSCDPVMCGALRERGFPARSLRPISSSAADLAQSSVVVVTPALGRQLAARVSARYAPTVLASFGPASARVSVRVIAPKGAVAYENALAAEQKISKTVGTGLVTSRQITVTPAAKAAMTAGRVDSRALIVITALASEHPIDILSFAGAYAGMSANAPLRVVDLDETDAAAHLSQSAYLRSMVELLRVQPVIYRPLRVSTISLASGQKALQIEFAAPSPLGLLNPPQ